MTRLEGRLSRAGFLSSLARPLAILLASLASCAWSLVANFPATLVIAGVGLLAGIASLLYLSIWLASVVTRFRLEGSELHFSRPCRRARTVPISDAVAVREGEHGAVVELRDGRSLHLSYDHLSNARDLAAALEGAAQPEIGAIEGCLDRRATMVALIHQIAVACLLLPVAALGVLILLASFRGGPPVPGAWALLPLGCLLLALSGIGVYFAAVRDWIGCVCWFRLENGTLNYRTPFSRAIGQRLADEVEQVSSHRPDSPEGEAGSWKAVHFRGGERIGLRLGLLRNAPALYEALKSEAVRRSIASRGGDQPPISPDHPLWPSIRPHLEAGERAYWAGRPIPSKLRSEIAAEVALGLLFLIPFAPASILWAWVSIAKGEPGALFGAAICAIFAGVGSWGIAAPWRLRRLMAGAVYAVTSRRAVVIRGFRWGTRIPIGKADEPEQSFGPRQVRDYQLLRNGRDIALGGEWRPGRMGRRYWMHFGFLAPDDPATAEEALRHLLAGGEPPSRATG